MSDDEAGRVSAAAAAALVGLVALLIFWRVHARLWRQAMRAAILAALREVTPRWIPGRVFVEAFGGRVYSLLLELEAGGWVERRTEPGGPERGGRERASYRWSLPGGP